MESAQRREIRLTLLAATLAVGVGAAAFVDLAWGLGEGLLLAAPARWGSALGSMAILGMVIFGVLAHCINRAGYFQRLRSEPTPPALDPSAPQPEVTILIPAYKEEPGTIRATLLSAALQTAGRRRIVLLIDDPPGARGADRKALLLTRSLGRQVQESLEQPRQRCAEAVRGWQDRRRSGAFDPISEARRMTQLLHWLVDWLTELEQDLRAGSDLERACADLAVAPLGQRLCARASLWQSAAEEGAARPESVTSALAALQSLFDVEITLFERKRYTNLSHQPSKAMNLNGYLSLMLGGEHWREQRVADGIALEPCAAAESSIHAPLTRYVMMVDADTVVCPEYLERMLAILEHPAHASLALAQAPYNAFPESASALERIAGATTDVQSLLHHGMSHWDAAFWVGANAVVRSSALRELRRTVLERGWRVDTYLYDSTVIEDTETTLEWRRRGWRLHSHPERLAYSATPRDFGALVVQRLRWANGGLLLVPALWRALRSRGDAAPGRRLAETLLRLHYLISLGPMSLALVLLPLCGFAEVSCTEYLPVLMLGYFGLYARDLPRAGYRRRDVAGVYALNLLLLPVNLLGLFLTARQFLQRGTSRFVRTPKVEDRTRAPGSLMVAEVGMLSGWLLIATHLALIGRPIHAFLMLAHAAILAYGVARFLGWREAWADFLYDVDWVSPTQTVGSTRPGGRPSVGDVGGLGVCNPKPSCSSPAYGQMLLAGRPLNRSVSH